MFQADVDRLLCNSFQNFQTNISRRVWNGILNDPESTHWTVKFDLKQKQKHKSTVFRLFFTNVKHNTGHVVFVFMIGFASKSYNVRFPPFRYFRSVLSSKNRWQHNRLRFIFCGPRRFNAPTFPPLQSVFPNAFTRIRRIEFSEMISTIIKKKKWLLFLLFFQFELVAVFF